jgi:endoribonuclease Dicer
MSYHYIDVLSQAFSPRDWQVELLAAAKEKNIIICLSQTTSKHFITLKLIHELGHQLRNVGKKTLILANHVSECFSLIEYLTDLKAVNLIPVKSDVIDWETVLRDHQVLLVQPEKMLDALICSFLDLENVNLIVLEDCHKKDMAMACDELIKNYYSVCIQKPKILGLAGPLHNAGCPIGRLGAELECLERTLLCQAETASDIVTVLRYSSRPKEIILQCAPAGDTEATDYLKNLILTRKSFINDHRYDPTEIYEGEEFVEELKAIPDPKVEPLQCLDDYLMVLEELGVWCADKACLSLLIRIEKLKVKTPYERHFLLLCMVGTTLVQARAYCDYVFQHSGKTVKENVMEYSSPKIRRLLDILKLYQPTEPSTPRKHHRRLNDRLKQAAEEAEVIIDAEKVLDTIAKQDLNLLSQNVETNSRNIETISNGLDNLKRLVTSIIEVNGIVAPDPTPLAVKNGQKSPAKSSPDRRNPANRNRNNRRKPMRSRNHQNSQDSDTLCGLIFCSSKFVTRILFTLLLELTRNDPDLAYLCVQYILDKAADPAVDVKEADAEHRKQEEVLKRFRMRECNLLIGTAVLEEGIDLPKCNLVIRWDPPTNYRSYVQCKGRARAYQALYIIMVAPQVQLVKRARSEYLTNKNHRHICGMIRGEPEAPEEENEEEVAEKAAEIEETASVKSELSSVDDDSDEICNYNIKCVVPEDADDDDDCSDEDEVPEAELKQQTMEHNTDEMIELLAQYMEIEKMLLRKCENTEPAEVELQHADKYTALVPAYNPKGEPDTAHVTLANAVSLVNKYCAKLPSDTFTKLTPLWRGARCTRGDTAMYQCTLRLPINSPIKYDILGVPMPTRILARRVTAFTACKILHLSGELDDNLMPIGKEGFKAIEPDWENFELDPVDEQIVTENAEPRPGTTKRRQYYFKRIAGESLGSVTFEFPPF